MFRHVNRGDKVQGEAMSEKGVWQILQQYATDAGVPGIAPHDCRRSCAKLCRAGGGELEQIPLLLALRPCLRLTTERYLGTKQDLVHTPKRCNQVASDGVLFACATVSRSRGRAEANSVSAGACQRSDRRSDTWAASSGSGTLSTIGLALNQRSLLGDCTPWSPMAFGTSIASRQLLGTTAISANGPSVEVGGNSVSRPKWPFAALQREAVV